MKYHVLDACAMLAALRHEPGGEAVLALLADENAECMAHAVNLCEVYYDIVRATGVATAEQAIQDLVALGLVLNASMLPALWQKAGQLKVSPGKLSLADCFCLALAITEGATLVTSDRHEFEPVDALGLCPILFIR